ncbi:endo-1,4-beta-xylanase [Proteiniphilum sp. UBA1028]|jgi:endo-1,4-beta-xylanase|uniref:endo-1,4-beta-xylanase n=1 Tax=Proteiniphilum sp. UBA1028 TaxID=1947251 RepID=UPI000E82AB12|nr:endo-1,4-beta-xylanase [Proteiniphilum sp. UBA1028]HBG57489.1 1,4-beta-xylanase [Porphyromonadaceae bacterium]
MKTKKTANRMLFAVLSSAYLLSCGSPKNEQAPSLKEAYNEKFLIGTALNAGHNYGRDTLGLNVITHHFNSIVAENCMKSMHLQPTEGVFFFDEADQFIQFGEENHMHIVGHTLIWHSQAPDWFFSDEKGDDVTREVLIERMRNYIHTVVGRYKGRVDGWDVVNEAILDDGSWRNTKFREIVGDDYIKLAFQFAREADPDAELYYNDYAMSQEGKRNRVVEMVKKLQEDGVRIDGIGMQGHMGMDYPDIGEFEKSIEAFAALGVKVMITEMDITLLPFPAGETAEVSLNAGYQEKMNPYANGLPEEVEAAFNKRYTDFFRLFLKHRDKISRVTLWGLTDRDSWRNDWPITGRTDYPLLFDRNYQPKPVVQQLIDLTNE